MFTTKKIAVVSVINDLVTDSRVQKTCLALVESGYEVKLVGRKLPHSLPLPPLPYKTKRINLLFKKGPLFYCFFNLRLFLFLLFTKQNLLFANDLDTLLPNYLVSRIKKLPIIYDSHELFCEVPELLASPTKRRIWQSLEQWIVPQLKHCITVNNSIANILTSKYSTPFKVVRNIPVKSFHDKTIRRPDLNLPAHKKIILLQGAGINIDRGAEELVEAMRFVENALLLIIGSGDVWKILEEKVGTGLHDKVRLIKKVPKEKLVQYTYLSDLGISLDKNSNLNYFNSLPNKIFDYIHAGVPILASRLPEIEKVINQFKVGEFIESHDPIHISKKINDLLLSQRLTEYQSNALSAAKVLTWEKEKEILLSVIQSATANSKGVS